ncbi:hypothetical protein [Inconstantimicrobium porci]|uniref:Uncharacterized protein n=1 Tax=Inconstantimicrobium porci TaxID=2652291 RepID=A0A7X2T0A6_9CLOT|nr:hypothetical protein [Inconstantimicrobium porci]MSR90377.1 hypothetical protein [Inconstantimicrobium porci]
MYNLECIKYNCGLNFAKAQFQPNHKRIYEIKDLECLLGQDVSEHAKSKIWNACLNRGQILL